MTAPTIWTAHRVGGRLLCGRMFAGRYVCQGEIGSVAHSSLGGQASPPPGYVEGPPGMWELSAHLQSRLDVGRRPAWRRKMPSTSGPVIPLHPSKDPWKARCPHCRAVVQVTPDVLL